MDPRARDLMVFDFDRTVLNGDSYAAVSELHPNLTPAIQSLTETHGWHHYMNVILEDLHQSDIPIENVKRKLGSTQLTKGFMELFQYLSNRPKETDCIVLSDANTFFIRSVLEGQGLSGFFKEILTNPAEILPGDRVQIHPYHHQITCGTCPKHMCKAEALWQWLKAKKEKGKKYGRICYFGDGTPDYCPIKNVLGRADIGFGRTDHPLGGLLTKNQPLLLCSVYKWKDGFDIARTLSLLDSGKVVVSLT